jgi:hypothetical protein
VKQLSCLLGVALISLAACEQTVTAGDNSAVKIIRNVPDGVISLASASQNLETVGIDQTTGCYVYRYEGPVETTFLPVRTTNGSPVCSREQ